MEPREAPPQREMRIFLQYPLITSCLRLDFLIFPNMDKIFFETF